MCAGLSIYDLAWKGAIWIGRESCKSRELPFMVAVAHLEYNHCGPCNCMHVAANTTSVHYGSGAMCSCMHICHLCIIACDIGSG
jgi:hypothetical protein